MAAEIGQKAPDFELKDQHGEMVKLSDRLGDNAVVVVFHPFSFTGICEDELCQIRDDYSEFEQAGVEVMTISCDPAPARKKWAEEQGLTFPVLSDFWPHGEVAKAYGVFNEDLGAAMRGTFVIGKDGVIVDAFETDSIKTPRDKSRYQEALAKL